VSAHVLAHGRYGRMLVNRNDLYVGEAHLHCGEYGEAEVSCLRSLVRPGDHLVMCGANIGSLVVPLAQAIGREGRVLAFEPQRHVFTLLCANIALNNCHHVEAFRYAVGADRGLVRIPLLDPDQKINAGGVSVGAGDDAVPCLSIDSMQLQRVDLLQADVEGSEYAVLTGAADTIAQHHPVLYLEADRPEQRGAMLTWLVDAGYEVYEHTPPLWNPDNFLQETEVRWKDVVSINWLCIHPDNPREIPESAHLVALWPTRGDNGE